MPRTARHKSDEDAYYHLCTRVAGSLKFYPFRNSAVSHKFMQVLKFYLRLYDQKLISFELLGNHYLCGTPPKKWNVKLGIMWS